MPPQPDPGAPMPIVVIGGGISGLACAWRLERLGLPVRLLEQEERPGGVIRSVRREGVLFEAGPQSFLLTPELAALIREAGLEDDLLLADPRAPRYLVMGGRLRQVPLGPALLFSSLLSWGTKMRLLSEPFGRTTPPTDDESIAAFVRRKFGAELLDRLVAPMVAGIYAGDAERLSLRGAFPSVHDWETRFGSVVRGAIKSRPPGGAPRGGLATLREGNESLVARLAERLGDRVSPRARAIALRRPAVQSEVRFEIECDIAGRRETIPAAAVVVATPARAAAALLAPVVPAATDLARIEYAPVSVVAGSYASEHVPRPLAGFGFLVPRTERLRVLGTVWNSSLFAGRVPEGQTLLTSFAGGMTDPSVAALPDDALFQTVESELRRVLGLLCPPRVRFTQRWAQAIPQYGMGHAELLRRVRAALDATPGLFLAGNYLEGPAIGACVAVANRVAEAASGRA
ncbi:MAG TPA: protoporphyrinogen oxidase [Candidatus Acidoferrales bacterium]|nr:protoporphyrinogen oxidase [Candidatus Acidoferrales bacterium]